VRVGNYEGEEVHAPFKALLPMVEPNDIVLGGWDISGLNMAEAMERAKVGVVVAVAVAVLSWAGRQVRSGRVACVLSERVHSRDP
jgi:hypothetical protein